MGQRSFSIFYNHRIPSAQITDFSPCLWPVTTQLHAAFHTMSKEPAEGTRPGGSRRRPTELGLKYLAAVLLSEPHSGIPYVQDFARVKGSFLVLKETLKTTKLNL